MKLSAMLIAVILFFSGCGKKTENENVKPEKRINSELVRDENTNVAALDANKDGLVYECPMDFQVISDTFTTCPVCKMDLEELSVADAQANLKSHYHK